MNPLSKASVKTAPKAITTPAIASKVQSITAKKEGGKPAPWVGNLQKTADARFGKSGAKAVPERMLNPQPLDRRDLQLNPNNPTFWKSRGLQDRPVDWQQQVQPKAAIPAPVPSPITKKRSR